LAQASVQMAAVAPCDGAALQGAKLLPEVTGFVPALEVQLVEAALRVACPFGRHVAGAVAGAAVSAARRPLPQGAQPGQEEGPDAHMAARLGVIEAQLRIQSRCGEASGGAATTLASAIQAFRALNGAANAAKHGGQWGAAAGPAMPAEDGPDATTLSSLPSLYRVVPVRQLDGMDTVAPSLVGDELGPEKEKEKEKEDEHIESNVTVGMCMESVEREIEKEQAAGRSVGTQAAPKRRSFGVQTRPAAAVAKRKERVKVQENEKEKQRGSDKKQELDQRARAKSGQDLQKEKKKKEKEGLRELGAPLNWRPEKEEEKEKGQELEALEEFSVDQKRVDWSDEVPCEDVERESEESIEGPYEDMELEGLGKYQATLHDRAKALRAYLEEVYREGLPYEEEAEAMVAATEQQFREAGTQWSVVKKRKKKGRGAQWGRTRC